MKGQGRVPHRRLQLCNILLGPMGFCNMGGPRGWVLPHDVSAPRIHARFDWPSRWRMAPVPAALSVLVHVGTNRVGTLEMSLHACQSSQVRDLRL